MFTSEQLTEGTIYTRDALRQMFNATIKNGVFQPTGYQSVCLFVTENKTKSSTHYKDLLCEDRLDWDGRTQGQRDRLIIEHETKGIELLVFCRINKRAGGFRYEGRFRYVRHAGSHPTLFILQRVFDDTHVTKNGKVVSEIEEVNENVISSYCLTITQKQNVKREQASKVPGQPEQIKLMYCYAHKDKRFRDALDKQLSVHKRTYHVVTWFDHEISPGIDWEKEINTQINSVHIILLLVSPDFMASEYCYGVEMRCAIERHERGEARVIPIILHPIAGWQKTPIGKLQALPSEGKPVTSRSWRNLNEALNDVAEGLERVFQSLPLQKTAILDGYI